MELAKTEVAVGDERAHAAGLGERLEVLRRAWEIPATEVGQAVQSAAVPAPQGISAAKDEGALLAP
jgi:hypothetical protein